MWLCRRHWFNTWEQMLSGEAVEKLRLALSGLPDSAHVLPVRSALSGFAFRAMLVFERPQEWVVDRLDKNGEIEKKQSVVIASIKISFRKVQRALEKVWACWQLLKVN